MSVSVQTSGGGPPPVRKISDSFNRTGLNPTPGTSTPLWQPVNIHVGPVNTPLLIGSAQVGLLNDGVDGLVLTSFGSDNPATSYPVAMCPSTFDSSVWGQTQFVQARFVFFIGTALGGISVMQDLTNGGEAGYGSYTLGLLSNSHFRLARYQLNNSGTAITETDLNGSFGNWVTGDVLRLSCQVVANANVLTVTQNGTQILQVSDGVGSLTTGIPGVFEPGLAKTAGVPGQFQCRNWSGGIGL